MAEKHEKNSLDTVGPLNLTLKILFADYLSEVLHVAPAPFSFFINKLMQEISRVFQHTIFSSK